MQLLNALLFSLMGSALAFPAAQSEGGDPGCCCCDASREVIVCNPDQSADDCICALVACPVGAPTITEAQPDPTPDPPRGKEECCCCDLSEGKNGAIVCNWIDKGDGCNCPMVLCPDDAPTLWPRAEPTSPPRYGA